MDEFSTECLEELRLAQQELTLKLKSEARRRCGFKRGEDELIKVDGKTDDAAVLRETHYECYHCGSRWDDTPAIRERLDRSSHYVPLNPKALPWEIGFNVPQWINRRLSWGKIMLDKLRAQRLADELGNHTELKKWWQKVAARTWDKDLLARAPDLPPASVGDVPVAEDGRLNVSALDFQFNGTHIPYQAWSIGAGKQPVLLHWEWIQPPAHNATQQPVGVQFIPYSEKVQALLHGGLETDQQKREFCKARVRQLNEHFKVQVQNCKIDAGHRPDLVREWAAEDAVYAAIKNGGRITKKWLTYGLLLGDDRTSYRWEHPGRKPTWERFKRPETVLVDVVREGRAVKLPVSHKLWSNPSIKDIAVRWRDGDSAPRIQVAAHWLADTSKEGFWAQMTSERKLPWKGRPGKLRYDNEGRPNHAWDGFCMMMVRMDELNFLNSFGAPAADDPEGTESE